MKSLKSLYLMMMTLQLLKKRMLKQKKKKEFLLNKCRNKEEKSLSKECSRSLKTNFDHQIRQILFKESRLLQAFPSLKVQIKPSQKFHNYENL